MDDIYGTTCVLKENDNQSIAQENDWDLNAH